MTGLAVAAPNPAAADAAEQVARAGGSAVDAAIAAALVAMVNEVGLVSLSSGGFVAVQPAAVAAYTVDGWVDRPGIGRAQDAEQADLGRRIGARPQLDGDDGEGWVSRVAIDSHAPDAAAPILGRSAKVGSRVDGRQQGPALPVRSSVIRPLEGNCG